MPSGIAGMMSADSAVMVIVRICKAALVAAVSLFFFIVAMDNLTDYGSNFQFVQHVLSMDDTFPGNAEMWRALHYTPIYHVFYCTIILTESTCAVACGYGAYRLFQARAASATVFYEAKIVATVGITLSLLLWLVAVSGSTCGNPSIGMGRVPPFGCSVSTPWFWSFSGRRKRSRLWKGHENRPRDYARRR